MHVRSVQLCSKLPEFVSFQVIEEPVVGARGQTSEIPF